MSEFYDDLASTAAEMLAEFGQAVTLTHSAAGTYNPATGTGSAPTVTTQTINAVEEAYSSRSIDGTLIRSGDKKLHLSPLDTSGAAISLPVPEDTVTFATGPAWTIKAVEPVSPGATPVLITVQIRQS